MKTIIFDLDGTLLPMDVNDFMKRYKESLESHFSTIYKKANLFEHVMTSVGHVVRNQEAITNDKKFFNHFFNDLDVSQDEFIKHFEVFYETEFSKVKDSTYVSKAIVEAVSELKKKGYKMIIATNPIFPMAANLKRIQWAGLDVKDFEYVSSFESNTACKPFLKFYEEVLTLNNLDSKDVLMVGNDAQEDLTIQKLGVKTYLINDHLINREAEMPFTDYLGSYEDFKIFVDQLDSL